MKNILSFIWFAFLFDNNLFHYCLINQTSNKLLIKAYFVIISSYYILRKKNNANKELELNKLIRLLCLMILRILLKIEEIPSKVRFDGFNIN